MVGRPVLVGRSPGSRIVKIFQVGTRGLAETALLCLKNPRLEPLRAEVLKGRRQILNIQKVGRSKSKVNGFGNPLTNTMRRNRRWLLVSHLA
jgi:hypothetical protein